MLSNFFTNEPKKTAALVMRAAVRKYLVSEKQKQLNSCTFRRNFSPCR